MRKVLLFAAVAALAVGCSKSEKSANTVGAQALENSSEESAPVVKQVTYQGPFGLQQGMTREEVEQVVTLKESEVSNVYSADTVPSPHPDFESYTLLISDKLGLCKIKAIGKNIDSGSYGTQVVSAFDGLEEALAKKYGKNKRLDYAAGMWDDRKHWMMGLLENDRTLATIWGQDHKSTLTDGISAVALQAVAFDMSTAYLTLDYEFENFDKCLEESKALRNQSL